MKTLTSATSVILSLLTLHRLEHWFAAQKNLDLRRFLVGDGRFISSVIDFAEDSFDAFLQAVSFLPLQPQTRDAIAQIINQSVASISVVFGLLLHKNQLVTLVRMKGQTLHPMDVHLIINLVRCSPSLKSAQSHWVPVCLPKFDANGFLYANITFSDDLTCLVLLTVDSTQFYSLDAAKDVVFQRLISTNDGEHLSAISSSSLPLLRDINVPQLRHLVCKYLPASQCAATDWATFYTACATPGTSDITSPNSLLLNPLQKDILSTYRRLHSRLHNPSYPVRMIYQSTPSEAFFAWKNDTFEVFCTLDPLTTKPNASEIRKTITKWLNSKKHQIFSLSNPTF
ncbi:unnamed protein product [Dicrocoelium dendriticum]|nr:unnamed protein product [Dicrocoelium dendriticum]